MDCTDTKLSLHSSHVKGDNSCTHESEAKRARNLNQTAGSSATQVRSAKRLSDDLGQPDTFQTKCRALVALCSSVARPRADLLALVRAQTTIQQNKIGDARSSVVVYHEYY